METLGQDLVYGKIYYKDLSEILRSKTFMITCGFYSLVKSDSERSREISNHVNGKPRTIYAEIKLHTMI